MTDNRQGDFMSDAQMHQGAGFEDWVRDLLDAGHGPGKIAIYLEQVEPGAGKQLLPWIRALLPSGQSSTSTTDPRSERSFASVETKAWGVPNMSPGFTPAISFPRRNFSSEYEPERQKFAFANAPRSEQAGLLTLVADRRTRSNAVQGLLSGEKSIGTRLSDGGVSVDIDPKVRLPDGSYYIREDDGGITVPLDPLPDRRSDKPAAPDSRTLTSTSQTGPQPRSVISTAEGVVGAVGWQNPKNRSDGMGWRIYVNQPDGSRIGFGHMDPSSTLKPGTKVKPGDVIGLYANPTNGNSTGAHVHVQMFDKNGKIVDPGNVSPLARSGTIKSKFSVFDSAHKKHRHQGVDWAETP